MTAAEIKTYLTTLHLPPTQTWLSTFTPTIRSTTPLPALKKTALFRLLQSDIRTSLTASATNTLPASATDPTTKTSILHGTIPVQVLDIHDVGHSTWSQISLLEAAERGEMTKGREIIRLAPDAIDGSTADGDSGDNSAVGDSRARGPLKVLMQDINGVQIFGFELQRVEALGQLGIGAKVLLRDVVVNRGVVLLEARTVEVLGGKVEAWDKAWRRGRIRELRRRIGAPVEGEGG
ncbi:hypothetical protein MBLNU457_g2704t1 [Dothideomycetes sp. NU457]